MKGGSAPQNSGAESQTHSVGAGAVIVHLPPFAITGGNERASSALLEKPPWGKEGQLHMLADSHEPQRRFQIK